MIKQLQDRKEQLLLFIEEKQRTLGRAPKGQVRVIPHGKGFQYYFRQNEQDKNGKYMRKAKKELAYRLVQKEYDEAVLKAAKEELHALDHLISHYQKHMIPEAIYAELSPGRQLAITPLIESEEEFLRRWKNEEYEKLGFREDTPMFVSESGVKMRSKSEVLIGNILERLQIPYHYEKPLYLNGIGMAHPDFTLLDLPNRKEVYYEHLGLLDEMDYRNKAMRKIRAYEKNGYYLGEQLLISAETSRAPFDAKMAENRIVHALKLL